MRVSQGPPIFRRMSVEMVPFGTYQDRASLPEKERREQLRRTMEEEQRELQAGPRGFGALDVSRRNGAGSVETHSLSWTSNTFWVWTTPTVSSCPWSNQ